MRTSEHTVTSVGGFSDWVQSNFAYGFLYRGVSDIDRHQLLPAIGRFLPDFLSAGKQKDDLLLEEAQAFRVFYKEARGLLDYEPATSWEWLAIAQHHGLPTRLLDWTYSALVALFFSVTPPGDTDAGVYVLERSVRFVSVREEKDNEALSFGEFGAFMPRHITPRIRAQSGLFTYHPDPTVPLTSGLAAKIRIPAKYRRAVRHGLNLMGFNSKVLFPDLDGLSRWLKWGKFDCVKGM